MIKLNNNTHIRKGVLDITGNARVRGARESLSASDNANAKMSLFQIRSWWEVKCGSEEEFDINHLVVGNVDNEPNHTS